MARKKVPRLLSSLPSKRLLQDADHKTERLAELLREAAIRNQREQPRPFYSMREVASHYRLPFAVVSRVYNRLQQEGLLTAVRGSKTILQAQQFDRHIGVRAFVGLPASLSAFVALQSYRMFFIRIRRELRLRGFATAMLFFETPELRTSSLSMRLKAYEVDTVVWFQPPRNARDTALRLGDLGIRLIGVAHEHIPTIFCRYEVRREHAIRTLLSEWRSRLGIDDVVLALWPEYRAPVLEDAFHSAAMDIGLRFSIANFQGENSDVFLHSLENGKADAIVFSSGELAARLCFRSPMAMASLMRRRRVAFLNGPASMPFAKLPDVPVDLVVVDWQWVAEHIVNDLVSQDAFQRAEPTIFEADAKMRVLLKDFAQAIY